MAVREDFAELKKTLVVFEWGKCQLQEAWRVIQVENTSYNNLRGSRFGPPWLVRTHHALLGEQCLPWQKTVGFPPCCMQPTGGYPPCSLIDTYHLCMHIYKQVALILLHVHAFAVLYRKTEEPEESMFTVHAYYRATAQKPG